MLTPHVKEHLHRRVAKRMAELMAVGAQLAAEGGNRERAQAIEAELQAADAVMSGGWERIGQREAGQLSKWLSKTEQLTPQKPTTPAAAQD